MCIGSVIDTHRIDCLGEDETFIHDTNDRELAMWRALGRTGRATITRHELHSGSRSSASQLLYVVVAERPNQCRAR